MVYSVRRKWIFKPCCCKKYKRKKDPVGSWHVKYPARKKQLWNSSLQQQVIFLLRSTSSPCSKLDQEHYPMPPIQAHPHTFKEIWRIAILVQSRWGVSLAFSRAFLLRMWILDLLPGEALPVLFLSLALSKDLNIGVTSWLRQSYLRTVQIFSPLSFL